MLAEALAAKQLPLHTATQDAVDLPKMIQVVCRFQADELQAQTPEDDSKAKSDPVGSNADLKPQADPTLSTDLGNDLASLLKDLTSGNTSAAKADVSKVQADLQTQDTSSVAYPQTGSTLDGLIGKISDSLDADSVPGAPQDGAQHDLANFLVENGQGKGSLINTSA